MADFLYKAGPPPPRSPFGNRPAAQQPPPAPGLRYLPPSQARGPPSPNLHAQQSSYPYDQFHQPSYTHQHPPSASPHRSPEPGFEPSTIKCSSCGEEVALDELGDHVCRPKPPQRDERRVAPANGELRVDVQAAAPPRGLQQPGYGAGMPMRSPMYAGHLEATPPHTPGTASTSSRPSSPAADQLSRSVGSNASASSSSSSRMPFFERYNKQYGGPPANGNMAGVGAGVGLPRSMGMDGLSSTAASGPSPRLSPAGLPYCPPSRSPTTSPFPSSTSAPNLNGYPVQDGFYHSPQQQHQQLPPQPPASTTPPVPISQLRRKPSEPYALPDGQPRTRKPSLRDRVVIPTSPPGAPPARNPSVSSSNSSAYLAYDRRETMKASQSTPADLSSYGSGSSSSQRNIQRKDSASDLDACLDDLRVFADAEEVGSGARAMLDEQYGNGRRRSYRQGGKEGDDPLTTPKASSSSRMPTSRSTPALANNPPSLSSSGSTPSLSSSSTTNSSSSRSGPSSSSRSLPSCTTCRRPLPSRSDLQLSGDGQPFCRPCFAERFLPKCRKCKKAIEGGAVTSSDGKVVGKYHRECFACFECGEKFENGEFYVFDGKPYCQQHYHALNGSLCANLGCGKPIEGPCVSLVGEENGGGGRYHPPCFNCSEPSCQIPLLEHHFVVDRLPYCEMHSAGPVVRRRAQKPGGTREDAQTRAKKRQTIITR
ncbi:hypothetical protein JCM8547_002383 [Rhodosporidiobolus lusitaniae]